MPKRIPWATLIAVSFAIGLALNTGGRSSCASDPGPRAAVEQYLRAMKEQRFADAYNVVTPDDSRDLYGRWASTYDKTFVEDNKYIYPQMVARVLAKHMPEDRKSTRLNSSH